MRLVEFSPVCDADVRRMHYKDAERVCLAVFEFAERGTGIVEIARRGPPLVVRIRARGGFALAVVEDALLDVRRILPTGL
jgi:hypothetical protein